MMNQLASTKRPTTAAVMEKHQWTARMVRPLSDKGVDTPSSFVGKTFNLSSVTGSETLRISALGLYICFINGQRVGNDILTPGWTAYDKRLSYQTYSVGDLLIEGENRIEIWLADGWYRGQMLWPPSIYNTWGDQIAVIAELALPGEAPLLATDATWESGEIGIRRSGIYFGEIFDANYVPAATHGTEVLEFDTGRLVAHETTPVRELETLPVAKSWQDGEKRTVYDFAQNSGGYVAFRVRGSAGARVIVEHAEVLDETGAFYSVNLRTADCRLEYTLKGEGEENYRPHFTFQGFRYARVTIEGEAELLEIVSVPISSVTEVKSSFTSGSPLVDKLFQNTIWSQRANFIEVPTDCPQRDERIGWTGDAQVFSGTACYLADAQGFFTKWIRDVIADQRDDGAVPHFVPDPTRIKPENWEGFFGATGWGDAISIVPWQLYLHYGDKGILEEALPAMVRWNDFVWSISGGPIVMPPRGWGERGFTFGDWLQPGGPSAKPLPTISDDAAATIYFYISSSLIARIAAIVGDDEVADRMSKRADEIKAAFALEFISPAGRVAGDDQTSYTLAFLYDLIPEDRHAAAKQYFRNAIKRSDGRIGTGFIGTPALLPALVKIGELGIAGEVLLQEGVPGWLYQVKMGATSIWERWDAIQPDGTIYNPRMNSYNHYAFGAVSEFLLQGVAGFRPDPEAPAFETIIFEPTIIHELSPVAAHHDSAVGTIRASWSVTGDAVRYEVEVPEGSKGVLRLHPQYSNATLNGQSIPVGVDQALAAGRHTVTFTYAEPARFTPKQSDLNAHTP